MIFFFLFGFCAGGLICGCAAALWAAKDCKATLAYEVKYEQERLETVREQHRLFKEMRKEDR